LELFLYWNLDLTIRNKHSIIDVRLRSRTLNFGEGVG
jgi:hypothetical protein